MHSFKNIVYLPDINQIKQIDIKYKDIRYVWFPNQFDFVTKIKENIFAANRNGHTCVLFKEPIFFKGYPTCSTMIVGDFLIFTKLRYWNGPASIDVYNLKNGTKKTISGKYYKQILESPADENGNTKILLILAHQYPYEPEQQIYNNINECINSLRVPKYPSNGFYGDMFYEWFNENEFVKISYEEWTYYDLVEFIDLNFQSLIEHEISRYELSSRVQNIAVGNNVLYLWFNKRILAINKTSVIEIQHYCNIEAYNKYNDLFVDSNLGLYKIRNGKLMRFRFEYDIWRDIDKPEQIHIIIATIMDLDMFPNEIYNIIYQCLVELTSIINVSKS